MPSPGAHAPRSARGSEPERRGNPRIRSHITPSRGRGNVRSFVLATAIAAALAALAVLLFPRAALAALPKSDSGAPVAFVPRPSAALRDCDPGAPICVHAAQGTPASLVRSLRAAVADAYGLAIQTLRIPAPLPDGPEGGDPRLDVYLVPPTYANASLVDGLAVGHDALDPLADRDAAPAYVLMSEDVVRAGGCVLRATSTRAVVRAAAAGLDVAEDPTVVDGFARRIGELAAPCPALERPGFIALQAEPWRALTFSAAGPELLARTLDVDRGLGYGAIVPGLLSMAIGRHGLVVPSPDDETGPAHFRDDPSVFDVLSATLNDAGSSLDELFLDVATVRARADVSPTYEWVIPTSTLPRRLAVRRGIEPTGSTFVRIDVDKLPPSQGLEIDLAWEQGARFLWRLVELDAAGKQIGIVPVPVLDTARKVTVEARHLANVKTLVLCGFNTGDPKRPWRPDDKPAPPHGYEIGIYAGT